MVSADTFDASTPSLNAVFNNICTWITRGNGSFSTRYHEGIATEHITQDGIRETLADEKGGAGALRLLKQYMCVNDTVKLEVLRNRYHIGIATERKTHGGIPQTLADGKDGAGSLC